MPINVQALLNRPSALRLPRLERELLLAHVLGVSRSVLYTHSETPCNRQVSVEFESLVHRRWLGEPCAYLVGTQEFWSLAFTVSPAVLIPRPETEYLVEWALDLVPVSIGSIQVLELGTGSGAVAVALAKERPEWQITAVDNSVEALAVARNNARRLGVHNIHFCHSNWFSAVSSLSAQCMLVMSNPPYIHPLDPHLQLPERQYEPISALISGPDGLGDLTHIVQHAGDFLRPGGWLLVEHGYNQAEAVRALANDYGFSKIQSFKDLAGIRRGVVAQKN